MSEEFEISSKVLEERAALVFVKITEMIYEVKKNRYEVFSGQPYVNSEGVLEALNSDLRVVMLNKKGQLIHKNF